MGIPLHFISGLPRSASTLLAALPRQNPRFHERMAGPPARLFGMPLDEMRKSGPFAAFLGDAKRRRILQAPFDKRDSGCSAEMILDTSLGPAPPARRVTPGSLRDAANPSAFMVAHV